MYERKYISKPSSFIGKSLFSGDTIISFLIATSNADGFRALHTREFIASQLLTSCTDPATQKLFCCRYVILTRRGDYAAYDCVKIEELLAAWGPR